MLLDIFLFVVYLLCCLFGWPARKWFYRNLYGKSNHWRTFSRSIRKEAGGVCRARYCTKENPDIHHIRYKLWFESPEDVVALCRGHHVVVENGQDVKLKNDKIVEGYRKWR